MKIIMLSGLPASGKSTKAKEIVEGGGNFVRVSKDNLREMLHFGKWNGHNEGITRATERDMVRSLLLQGLNVVVDDTNLGEKHKQSWQDFAKEIGASFQHIHLDTPWQECVTRDASAERKVPVGRTVIVNMALQYKMYVPMPEKPIVICDLDGTLADTDWRVHHVQKEPKNWAAFHAGIPHDKPREDVKAQLLELHDQGYPIVFMSGRSEHYIEETKTWLKQYWPHQYLALIMRKENDTRKDDVIKSDLYTTYLSHYPILKVIDDRPSVIRMWRTHGLEVVDVGKGVEF